ncbi:hypothetical protein PACTADRAFT_59249 [Pachysolen tannophilus NRRL Y-2460]|uniref:Brix domain-containing protein n=1 Tax=Pachysolen tannophilus NRRL Y-2460 TaxID=669874 RepID=A0A1E4TSM8_PACTA|nr:hypothetical protein PACTADRAFT_59249 [Pachysolen tannophilus NRRL Y-2460]
MGKRRIKKRTHTKVSEEQLAKIPRSMVIRTGDSLGNHSLNQLVKDMRNMMQPHTAIKLRERKSNRLRDFIVMAGPLGVTQLMVFSKSESGTTHLRFASIPKGPTFTFKVNNYSLNKDIRKFMRNPKSLGKDSSEFLNSPLLVMNGFKNPKTAEPHEALLVTMFQNMFPPISPQATKINSIKRVLMLNKDPETGIIDLRHYAIDTKLVEGTKGIKKLINAKTHLNKKLPNLAKSTDVVDLVLDPYANAYTSESEIEEDAVVEIKDDAPTIVKSKAVPSSKSQSQAQTTASTTSTAAAPDVKKRAVKLTEIGPRLNLSLIKIEEGVCSGKVLYHSYIKKSANEVKLLDAKHAQRQREREARKKEQKANIDAKKATKAAKKLRRKQREEARARGEAVEDEEISSDSTTDSEDEEMDVESDVEDENLF